MIIPYLVSLVIMLATPPMEVGFPAECQLNQDCWLLKSDNNGCKIAVKPEKSLPVVAAQDGTVAIVEGDIVIIKHPDDWKTAYTNLKRESITVKKDDLIKKGQQIAESSILGFSVYKEGEFIRLPWDFSQVVLADAGANQQEIWVQGFNFKKGDIVKFGINNPDGKRVFNKIINVDKDQEEATFTVKTGEDSVLWPAGEYKAKVELIRIEAGIAKALAFSFNMNESEKPAKSVDVETIKKQEEDEKQRELELINKKRIFMYKKLYEEGKMPATTPQHVKDKLKNMKWDNN